MLRILALSLLSHLLNSVGRAEQVDPMLQLSADSSFHFQLLGTLAQAVHSGADISPVLGIAQDIEAGNLNSFSHAFYELANATKEAALDPENACDPVNVRNTWFAAATYFRNADFYLHGDWNDPLIHQLWEEQVHAFDQAISALPIPGQRVRIAGDGLVVEAIWYRSSNGDARRPTLILGNGYDGSQEDLYHTIVVPALARGWNCITYEGPGQPLVRRRQDLGFIPDWERVVSPVVDYLLQSHSAVVDPTRLVLFGYSFGGYLAARAAAFEPRLSAVMLDGGIMDTYEAFSAQLPTEALEVFNSGNRSAFDALVQSVMGDPDVPTSLRWGVQQGLWSFRTKSAYDFLQTTRLYNLTDVIHQIKIPVWTADAELEGFFVGQSAKVKEALGSQATYHLFEGKAGYHCQLGAFNELNRVMFSWLRKTVGA
jgi:pimeloyl-ACP methyl ester carboxylesterase